MIKPAASWHGGISSNGRLPGGAATLAGVAGLFVLLLVSRDPRVLLHAEFWGDDGWSWYPDAYNHGAASLLIPAGGYLNSLQRLGGLLAQLVPLRWAPTLFAAIALTVQVLPPLFLVSSRMAGVVPSAAYRLLIALTCLMLPNVIEPHANLTNSQWHLAVLTFLILVAAPPVGWVQRGFDVAVLTISGLSGPFCLMLIPLAAARLWRSHAQGRRSGDDWLKVAILAVTLLVQIGVYLGSPPGVRSHAPLGAGPRMLLRVVATQVLLGAELGYNTIRSLPSVPVWQGTWLPLAVCGVAGCLAVVALRRGGWPLRGLCLFAGLLLAAALARPQASTTEAQWPLLAIPPMGNRYFFIPMLAWVAVLFTLAADRAVMLRGLGIVLLLVMLGWGIPHDWRYLDFPRTDFVAQTRAFAQAPPGTAMPFPQLPPGTSPMWLVKR